ncbi:hypothetical protein VLK31_33700 [Variovorax sp. H27-G14]|uniref:hypothetical protein n=1 Tax=Variovorax sp. H27-G14 TaxID=3111914 RepID=UPI0038FC387C
MRAAGSSAHIRSSLHRRGPRQQEQFPHLSACSDFRGQLYGEFVKVADKFNKYDPKYFGTYKSHVSGDIDTDTYTDKRASFLNTSFVRYGVPLAIGLAIWGGWKSWAFFHPEAVKPKPGSVSVAQAGPPVQTASAAPVAPPSAQKPLIGTTPPPDAKTPQERYFSDLGAKGRVRLSGLLLANGRVAAGVVEWVDGGARVIERIGLDTMRQLGVSVEVIGPAVVLRLGEWNTLATMWPVEAEGKVSEYRQAVIRGSADHVEGVAPSGLSLIDSGKSSGGVAPVGAPVGAPGDNPASRVQPGSKWSFQAGA